MCKVLEVDGRRRRARDVPSETLIDDKEGGIGYWEICSRYSTGLSPMASGITGWEGSCVVEGGAGEVRLLTHIDRARRDLCIL